MEYMEEIKEFIKDNAMEDVFTNVNTFSQQYNVNLYTYIRVSTDKQEFGRQILELYTYCKKNNMEIFIDNIRCDKYTGKKTDREGYQDIRQLLKPNDYLIVSELNRLGRNWDNTKKEWEFFQENNINIIVMDNDLLSAKLPNDKQQDITLDYKFVQAIVFNAINYVSSKKIEEVSRTTKNGMAKAKLKGKKIGRPTGKYATKENFIATLKLQANGMGINPSVLQTRIPKATFIIWLREYREKYGIIDKKELLEILESEKNQ